LRLYFVIGFSRLNNFYTESSLFTIFWYTFGLSL